MAVDAPTYVEFIARFPNFSDATQAQIEAIITEATSTVDESWRVEDQKKAIMYLVAHMLQIEAEQIEGGAISSESFGPISVTYARNTNESSIGSTVYGRYWLALARLNFAGPRFIRAAE